MGFLSEKKEIAKVKFLGLRSAEETKILATYNTTIYCLIVLFKDGTKGLVECETKEFVKKYLQYIEI